MASDRPSKIVPPTGLRTPSPTKSRLPMGSALPSRSTSVRGLQDVSLPPASRKLSLKGSEPARRPLVARTRLQQSTMEAENFAPSARLPSRVESQRSMPTSIKKPPSQSPSSMSPSDITSNQPLVYSRETLDPRLDLLHLHVVYGHATESFAQWQQSTSRHYQHKFEMLQRQHDEIKQSEIQTLTQVNAKALLSWMKQSPDLVGQIQTLSGLMKDLELLTSEHGKYTITIQAFEHWAAYVSVNQEERARSASKKQATAVEGLGDGWSAEIEYLQAQIIGMADTMLGFSDMETSGSDLERAFAMVSEMLKNMLEELDMISMLQTAILQNEEQWIEGSVANITYELGQHLRLL